MVPEIFYLNETHCCLMYKDYLVVNLPIDEIQERINIIDTGWQPGPWKRFWDICLRYLFFRYYLENSSKSLCDKLTASYTTTSFKLDKYLRIYLNGSDLLIWRIFVLIFGNTEKKFFEGQETTLLHWLDKNLSERGFSKKTIVLGKKAQIMNWVSGFIGLFILVFVLGYEGPPANLWDQIIAFAIIAGIITLIFEFAGWFIRLLRKTKQGPRIVYRKKSSETYLS